jgi:type IV pilus assembly protein PilA
MGDVLQSRQSGIGKMTGFLRKSAMISPSSTTQGWEMTARHNGFTMIEMMVVAGVVVLLSLLALPSYLDKMVKEQVLAALPLADIAKSPVALAWALSQPLPANNEAAGLPAADKIVSNLVSSVAIDNGSINITFGNNVNGSIKGKILTLRPAVVEDSPIVPIAWVCGSAKEPEKMKVKGENKTNVPATYLPLSCRAPAT